jgi:hypothetical protein
MVQNNFYAGAWLQVLSLHEGDILKDLLVEGWLAKKSLKVML